MQGPPRPLPELASAPAPAWPGPNQLELLLMKPAALPLLAGSLLAQNPSNCGHQGGVCEPRVIYKISSGIMQKK